MRELKTVTLRELLPPSIAKDPDVLAAADAIDRQLQAATNSVPNVSIIPRVREIADSVIIDLLAWQFHVDFYDPELPLETRRDLVSKSLDWHTRKGTPSVVEEIVTAVLSDAEVIEWYQYGGDPYFFRINTSSPLEEEAMRSMIEAVYSVKNTRSWLEAIYLLFHASATIYVSSIHSNRNRQRLALTMPESSLEKRLTCASISYNYTRHSAKGAMINGYG